MMSLAEAAKTGAVEAVKRAAIRIRKRTTKPFYWVTKNAVADNDGVARQMICSS
jgi:hypothetical protein